mgnify:CR=1 FL=1
MQLETRKEKEKRVKKNRRHTRIGLLSIAGFVCVFLIIFLIANNNLKSKSAENQAKIEELQESIEEQKKRSEDLDEQKEYTKTKEYIEKIYVCNLYELENFPFEKVDYVFTTVHISSYVPVPILEIGSFLQDNDIDRVRKLFVRESKDFLQKYFKKELFFTDVEGKTKDEVLKNLCRKVEQEKGLPETFTASVLKREELTPTDYGNLVALPHPERAFQERAFVAVAVLKEPIFWFRQKVQVVFLTAIGREEDENLQQFYEATTDLILRPADVQNLIRHPDYDRLIQLLRRAEE